MSSERPTPHLRRASPGPLSYHRSARRRKRYYVLLVLGALLIALGSVNGLSSGEAFWARMVPLAIGALSGVSALAALVFDWQVGSAVDLEGRELEWWAGYPPLRVQTVRLDDIARIHVDTSGDSPRLTLFDAHGQRVYFNSDCAPTPWEHWATSLHERFPHIQVEHRSA